MLGLQLVELFRKDLEVWPVGGGVSRGEVSFSLSVSYLWMRWKLSATVPAPCLPAMIPTMMVIGSNPTEL